MPTTVDDPDAITVAIRVDDPRWHAIAITARARAACHAAIGAAVAAEGWAPATRMHISLLAGDDATLQALNRQFRDKDQPTDVLSFPANASRTPDRPDDHFLGDVALGFESCHRGAAEASAALADHVEHLVIHGCLHLLGFDHDTEENHRKMSDLETRALAMIENYVP